MLPIDDRFIVVNESEESSAHESIDMPETVPVSVPLSSSEDEVTVHLNLLSKPDLDNWGKSSC